MTLESHSIVTLGYYGPEFARLHTGWFWQSMDEAHVRTRRLINEIWSEAYLYFIDRYLDEHGVFWTAFHEYIAEDIEVDSGFDIQGADYYEYYLASKALDDQRLRARWYAAYEMELGMVLICEECGKAQHTLMVRPAVYRRGRGLPSKCSDCIFK